MRLHSLRHEFTFWLHLLLLVLTWVAPFWFSWWLIVPVYASVMLQFVFFGRCLMNEGHSLSEENDMTFYAYLFEKMGFTVNRRRLKRYVRRVIYPVLSVVAIGWQVWLGNPPVFF